MIYKHFPRSERSREVPKRFTLFLETRSQLVTRSPFVFTSRSTFPFYYSFEYFIDSLPLASLKQCNLAPGLAQEIYTRSLFSIIFARVKNVLACQGNISNMLLCEYLLLACQKKVTDISLWENVMKIFFLLPSKFLADVPLWVPQLQFPLEVHLA